MAKNKVSEWSATPANNTDIGGIDIAEGCAPSGINNAIRELMAQVKDMQSGTDSDNFTVGGNLSVTGTSTFSTGGIVPSGGIILWSGSIANIPTGWYLCNGANGTPDLRNKFVIGAFQDNSGVANTTITGSNTLTGGSKDAIVVSHTHTVNDTGHTHVQQVPASGSGAGAASGYSNSYSGSASSYISTQSSTTGITINSSGTSGTDANLVPYYALAYIMKA